MYYFMEFSKKDINHKIYDYKLFDLFIIYSIKLIFVKDDMSIASSVLEILNI